jgi:hypothetical protein
VGRYIALPIKRDSIEAEEQAFGIIREQFPGWQGADADPIALALRTASLLYADTAEIATRMAEEAFRYYGRGVVNLPPEDETAATATVRITAQDAAGPYEVPEGLEVAGRNAFGALVGFRTLTGATVPNGSTTVDVLAEATEEGTGGNGITGAGEFLEYVDYLDAVEFVGITSGGQDAETDSDYLDRLATELQLMSPRPILPDDFAVLARRLGAFRATAIDGLDPVAGTTGNPAMVAVAMVDEAGNPLPGADKTRIAGELDAMREVGFAVSTFDPTYTIVDVTATATAYPGWDPASVEATVEAELADYLSPVRWGEDDAVSGGREWLNEPTIRYLEVAERMQRVQGLRFVDTLTIGVNGGAQGTANITLTGYAPLPQPGAINVTVTEG